MHILYHIDFNTSWVSNTAVPDSSYNINISQYTREGT
jgi:hypothetical protein